MSPVRPLKSAAAALMVLAVSTLFSPSATLSVSFASVPSGTSVNLTTNGILDWVHWGLFTETSLDRKAGVTPQISDFTLLDASNGYSYVYQYGDNLNGYTWGDGTPHMTITNTTTGVWAYGIPPIGSGFSFSVPADTATKTLRVYVGAYNAEGQLTAVLSDKSAPGYTNGIHQAVSNIGSGPSGVYTINFAAASSNQSLLITYTLIRATGANGNVTLQSAALTAAGANNIPFVTLTAPADGASVVGPTNVTLSAVATDADGAVSLVEFYANGTKIGDTTNAPYSVIWTNPAPGRSLLTAKAIDNAAGVGASAASTLFVSKTNGSITASRSNSPAAVNLSTEGYSDWAHWGLVTATDFNHRASGGSQIANFAPIGANPVRRYSDNFTAFSWSDGAPVSVVANTNTGVFVTGLTNGFQFTVPADTTPRTLRVYAGLYGAQGNFQAWLTDFSGRAYVDTTLSNEYDNVYACYTLTYAAGTSNQQLVVRYTVQNLYDLDYGNVTLQAATLQGPVPPSAVAIVVPARSPGLFWFSFATELNKPYAAQMTPTLSPPSWQTFTNVLGNGGSLSVTDWTASSSQRFYRVISQ